MEKVMTEEMKESSKTRLMKYWIDTRRHVHRAFLGQALSAYAVCSFNPLTNLQGKCSFCHSSCSIPTYINGDVQKLPHGLRSWWRPQWSLSPMSIFYEWGYRHLCIWWQAQSHQLLELKLQPLGSMPRVFFHHILFPSCVNWNMYIND